MQYLLKHLAWCCHSRSLLPQLLVGLLICLWLASSSFNTVVFHLIVLVYSNGCFSEWLKRSQEKHTSVLCPQCRAAVQFVGRNHYLLNIAEVILYLSILLKKTVDWYAGFYAVVFAVVRVKYEKLLTSFYTIEFNTYRHTWKP